MTESDRRCVVLIAGPTSSGKSALALQRAVACNGVIINADSMQVYRELRVLTARPSIADEAVVPHRLYGHVSGAEDYSVGRWLEDARGAIDACWAAQQVPIITGGTGLYFKALEEGLAEIPPIDPAIKETWRIFAGDVHAELGRRDASMAARLNPADHQRIRRALEVIDATGRSLAWWQEQGKSQAILRDATVERIYVDLPRAQLHERAAARFDLMLAQGALDEVRSLPDLDAQKPLMKAIGVPELQGHLKGLLSLAEARERAIAATRQYIKRQSTWWRGQMKGWSGPAR